MKASFGADIKGLRKPTSVWMDDATYKDTSGTATFTSGENAEVTNHLSNAGKAFHSINSRKLTKFLNLQNSLTGKLAGASLKTYNNSKVRKGEAISNPKQHAAGYITWVENHFAKEIDKVKTEKSKDVLRTKGKEYAREFKKELTNLEAVIAFHVSLGKRQDGDCKKTK